MDLIFLKRRTEIFLQLCFNGKNKSHKLSSHFNSTHSQQDLRKGNPLPAVRIPGFKQFTIKQAVWFSFLTFNNLCIVWLCRKGNIVVLYFWILKRHSIQSIMGSWCPNCHQLESPPGLWSDFLRIGEIGNSKALVRMNYPKPFPLLVGVPHGSILEPLLFLAYINELPAAIEQSEVSFYADDTVLYYLAKLNLTSSRASWMKISTT